MIPPTAEAKWLVNYIGGGVTAIPEGTAPILLPIPTSRRPVLRGELQSVELWLAHVESLYAADYVAAGHPGAKLRYSPWVEALGPAKWRMGLPSADPLQPPHLIAADGQFFSTGSTLDLALSSPAGSVTCFGVLNDRSELIGLTRDGRLYLGADRKLVSRFGPLDGLRDAIIPSSATAVEATPAGMVICNTSPETAASFGPVRLYRLTDAMAEMLIEIDGLYSLPVSNHLPEPVTPDELPGALLIGKREQPQWNRAWFFQTLGSISETRALVNTMLTRIDEALLLEQTQPGPVRVELKTDITPFKKIFDDWVGEQSGARRRPPLRFRQDKRMILSRAYFAARKAPIRADGDDILLEFPPPDPASGKTPVEQNAALLADCARYLRLRMSLITDNLAHMYEIVETIQVGAEKKPRQDRAPRIVSLDETTGAFEPQPIDKAFRTHLAPPGNPNAIDPQGTVYVPNVNANEEIAEYRSLEAEYRIIVKALAVVQPELILDDPPALIPPAKPTDWGE